MAGIYIHFPFCKQACTYCNFHFSTSSKNHNTIIEIMLREIELRVDFFENEIIDSIYFGGGSPSLLAPKSISFFILKIKKLFNVSGSAEITLELNPDDSSIEYLKELKIIGINRLSLGIQSFIEEDLSLMKRVHSSYQAYSSIENVSSIFKNFSIDLIYGLPNSNLKKWMFNLNTSLSYEPPHLSCYALTVEPKTVLKKQIISGEVLLIEEFKVEEQYLKMVNYLQANKYDNYEFSSFAKPGNYSINNNGYWKGNPYLGIGPSAHSFDGKNKRSWNVNQNNLYVKSIKESKLPLTEEYLSLNDIFNETIMTSLRTSTGVSVKAIRDKLGDKFANSLKKNSKDRVVSNDLYWDGDYLHVSKKSKFLTDGIASDLFIIDL